MKLAMTETSHPSAETLVAYLMQSLSEAERVATTKHLDECDVCLRQLVTMHRAMEPLGETPMPPGLKEKAMAAFRRTVS